MHTISATPVWIHDLRRGIALPSIVQLLVTIFLLYVRPGDFPVMFAVLAFFSLFYTPIFLVLALRIRTDRLIALSGVKALIDQYVSGLALVFAIPQYPWLIFFYGVITAIQRGCWSIFLKQPWIRFGLDIGLVVSSLALAYTIFSNGDSHRGLEYTFYFIMLVMLGYFFQVLLQAKQQREDEFNERFFTHLNSEKRLLRHSMDNMIAKFSLFEDQFEANKGKIMSHGNRIGNAIDGLAATEPVDFDVLEETGKLCAGLHADIQCSGTPLRVRARKFMVLLAIENYLCNAVESGASRVTVAIAGSVMRIEDNGAGFDPKETRFGQSTKKTGHGHGLVYAAEACRSERVGAHVASVKGSGTTVELDFSAVTIPS